MDKQKLRHLKKLLLEEKKDVLNTISLMDNNEPNASMQEYYDELSMYDNHPADLGTEMFMVEQNMNLKNNEKLTLDEIEKSLEKIENGTYGKCELCGKEIGFDRLEVLPHANICIDCAEDKIPIDEMMDYRPKEEENLQFPFGRTFKDISEEDSVEFDGEDSWQSVARFNDVPGDPSFTTGDNLGVFDEVDAGIVQSVEQISEGYYKGQIAGLNREDIPDDQKKDKER